MRFQWHWRKAEDNIEWHGVSFEEAATVFGDPLAEIEPDFAHSIDEDRFLAFGTSVQGRLLVVVFTERGDTIRIISAREMTPRERRDYELYD
jgi:uncharacterized DUF497 family protein